MKRGADGLPVSGDSSSSSSAAAAAASSSSVGSTEGEPPLKRARDDSSSTSTSSTATASPASAHKSTNAGAASASASAPAPALAEGFWISAPLPEQTIVSTLSYQKQALRARLNVAGMEKAELKRDLASAQTALRRAEAVVAATASAWDGLIRDLEHFSGTAAAAVFGGDSSKDAGDQSQQRWVSHGVTKQARAFVQRLLAAGSQFDASQDGSAAATPGSETDPRTSLLLVIDDAAPLTTQDIKAELERKSANTKLILERVVELLTEQGHQRAKLAAEVREALESVVGAVEADAAGSLEAASAAQPSPSAAAVAAAAAAVASGELEEGEVVMPDAAGSAAKSHHASSSGSGSAGVGQLPTSLRALAVDLSRLAAENEALRKQLEHAQTEKRGITKEFNNSRDRVSRAEKAAAEAILRIQEVSDSLEKQKQSLARTRAELEEAQKELQRRPKLGADSSDAPSSAESSNSKEESKAVAPATHSDSALGQKLEALQEMYDTELALSAQREQAKLKAQQERDELANENDRLRHPKQEDLIRFDYVRELAERTKRHRDHSHKEAQTNQRRLDAYRAELIELAKQISEPWVTGDHAALRDLEERLRESKDRFASEQRQATKLRSEVEQLKSERTLAETLDAQRRLYEELAASIQQHISRSHARPDVSQITGDEKEIVDSVCKELDELSAAFEAQTVANAKLLMQLNEKERAIARHVSSSLKTTQIEAALKDESTRMQRTLDAAKKAHAEQHGAIAELELQLKQHSERARLLQRAAGAAQAEAQEAAAAKRIAEDALADAKAEVQRLKARSDELSTQHQTARSERTQALHDRDKAVDELKKSAQRADRYKRLSDAIGKGDTKLLSAQVTDLRRKITCSLCNDREKDAVITRCFHVFCSVCINKNIANRNRKCPTCKKGFDTNDIKALWLDVTD